MVTISEDALAEQPTYTESSQNDVVLSVQGVSKKFCRDLKRSLVYGVQDITRELSGLRGSHNEQLRKKEFWALRIVDLELRRGDALGLVGKNGSGKSTLLRVIAGLIKPDTGIVTINGRVAPLIALGAGFNPILTGRENIYANMAILGLSKAEIDERFDEVVEFAEIENAIDSPVQSYSSGMAARLGFSCAIHTDPDVMLIDEVLAVGDVRFKAKCHRKLSSLLELGKSFVLVSHQSHAILNVCSSALYLSDGKFIATGKSHQVMTLYEQDLFGGQGHVADNQLSLPEKNEEDSKGIDIVQIQFRDFDGKTLKNVDVGSDVVLCVECKVHKAYEGINLFMPVREIGGDNKLILHMSSYYDNEKINLRPGNHEIRLRMYSLGLKPGLYDMKVFLKKGSFFTLDVVESFRFQVSSPKDLITRGTYYQQRAWEAVCIDENAC